MAKYSDWNDEHKNELEEKWNSLSDQAQYFRGVSETGNHIVPQWFDYDKIEKVIKFGKTHVKG